ncbi:sensor histidine kinase [Corynebacterium sp. CCM 9185]|uniref:Sensor histidine kinase n=1 Tax=Corynebacterium marambiense TaxID=2765364 RepID=A0ABS0VU28_9CORY|nr:sensor histidine kinase [Corynebacterium marambiense]MBI9000277.1 sensor histidine kinase [Corynebacterium marambiense]MCK7663631.1 sensor histidine kinase [Corynebacterium marambiense]MCX7541935.1 sensor histidine kinase [Corynebacterium marambiense]
MNSTTSAGRRDLISVPAALTTALWLVFLAPAIAKALTGDHPVWVRVASVTTILVFGALYVALYGFLLTKRASPMTRRRSLMGLTGLLGLTVLNWLLIGHTAVGMLYYPVAWAGIALPILVSAPLIGGSVVVFFLAGMENPVPMSIGIIILGWAMILTQHYRYLGLREAETQNKLAILTERERLAHDMHDTVGQTLTAVTVKLQLAERLVDAAPEDARDEIAESRELTRRALNELRSVVAGLRESSLDFELSSAADILGAAGIRADLPANPPVDEDVEKPMAWVVREATTNVVRHSRARTCRVTVAPRRLVVADDGTGFRADPEQRGNGLRSMRSRVESTGGTFTVDSGENSGTTVEATWP